MKSMSARHSRFHVPCAAFLAVAVAIAIAIAGVASADVQPAPSIDELIADRATKAETLFNLGVERYRMGDLEAARTLFSAAATRGSASVAARAMYNRGTTRYVESLPADASPTASRAAPAAGTPSQSTEVLERALQELKDAIRADPTNRDARANAELAYRRLKELKQEQQQDQQQQDQQQQDQQQQDQQQQDQQQQDQQQQDQQQQDQQQQDQQQQDQQQQDQQQQDQQQQGQQQQGQQQQAANERAEQAEKPLTRQQVERLLQKIREREKARLTERARRERGKTAPADRDW
jgi:Ca-activated chloride channel family protein